MCCTPDERRSARRVEGNQDCNDALGSPFPVTLDKEVLYGLLREGLPETRTGLLQIPRVQLRAALERAKGAHTIAEMERLNRVTPRYPETKSLRDAGLGSARAVVCDGKSQFEAEFGVSGKLENVANAKRVYQQAKAQAAAAAQLHLLFNLGANGPAFRFTPKFDTGSPPSDPLVDDWTTLFGVLDGCKCEHCASVFSA